MECPRLCGLCDRYEILKHVYGEENLAPTTATERRLSNRERFYVKTSFFFNIISVRSKRNQFIEKSQLGIDENNSPLISLNISDLDLEQIRH